MKVKFNGVCDKGLKRAVNQDAILMMEKEECSLFAVADGMGGHSFGERASEMIVGELRSWCESFSAKEYDLKFGRMMISLRQQIEHANRLIYKMYNQDSICGTTLVVLFAFQNNYAVISCGDSRIYRMRHWNLRQLTKDDVWENQIGIRGRFEKRELEKHSNYGKLVSAIGIEEDISLNITTAQLSAGDKFLLCSDGLYKMCKNRELRRALREYKGKGGEYCLQKLLQRVYRNGAEDNVSVIMVEYVQNFA